LLVDVFTDSEISSLLYSPTVGDRTVTFDRRPEAGVEVWVGVRVGVVVGVLVGVKVLVGVPVGVGDVAALASTKRKSSKA